MFRKLIPMVMAGYALWQWDQRRRQRSARQVDASRAKPEPVAAWEGEGGSLRGVASPPA